MKDEELLLIVYTSGYQASRNLYTINRKIKILYTLLWSSSRMSNESFKNSFKNTFI